MPLKKTNSAAAAAAAAEDVNEIDEDFQSEEEEDDDAGFKIDVLANGKIHYQRRAVEDLIELLESPYLILNPPYQRDVVWTTDRMTKLINSLMSGYYIPPLIFNVKLGKDPLQSSRNVYWRTSIDGKQRLTSIKKFVAGEIPCFDRTNKRWWFLDNGEAHTSKRVLPEWAKKKFLRTELLAVEYNELDQEKEEDLFSRVQLGVPLTPAEKLKASTGVWQSFALELEEKYSGLMTDLVDTRRARGFQLILQILKQLLNIDEPTKSQSYTAGAQPLKSFCNNKSLFDLSIQNRAHRVFTTFDQVRIKCPTTFHNHGYKHSTRFSPIEFVSVAILIARYPNRRPGLLAGDILAMRTYLREVCHDLRTNTGTWKAVLEFCDNLEIHRGGAGVLPTTDTRRPDQGGPPTASYDIPFVRNEFSRPLQVQSQTSRPSSSPRAAPTTSGFQAINTVNTNGVRAGVRAPSSLSSPDMRPPSLTLPVLRTPPLPSVVRVGTSTAHYGSSSPLIPTQQKPQSVFPAVNRAPAAPMGTPPLRGVGADGAPAVSMGTPPLRGARVKTGAPTASMGTPPLRGAGVKTADYVALGDRFRKRPSEDSGASPREIKKERFG